jgi:hypothetical protein
MAVEVAEYTNSVVSLNLVNHRKFQKVDLRMNYRVRIIPPTIEIDAN